MNLITLKALKIYANLSREDKELINKMSKEYESWNNNLSDKEKYLIRKYTLNSFDNSKPNRFFERLNRALRGDYNGTDKNKLLDYGKIISNAICKQPTKQSIICYRGIDIDLLSNVEDGSAFKFDQFVSTSIIEKASLKKQFKYVIIVPEGTNGAYIEDISAFKGQFEFLIDYNCTFMLKARSGKNVYLEVVSNEKDF